MSVLRSNFQRFLASGGYCTPPGRAACALSKARTLIEFEEAENAGLVRISAVAEVENYFDVYGKPDDEREYKELVAVLERDGVWCVRSEVFEDGEWVVCDSVGMCAGYESPIDPFCNDYVPDLMAAALVRIPQCGEH